MSIVDALEREAALDPARSCIVQAPAGSGKTGLLIQRVLRLLAIVERPEEILAITFTRKAAAEMRRRLMQALERAAGEAPARPNDRLTWQLARAALERDRERGWRLRDNASRLRIQTIDSLCASLARQMPVLSGIGAPLAIVEDARELYRESAERTLAAVEGDDAAALAVRRLLAHLDGDWAAARALLESMLAKRDQWIRRVVGFPADGAARQALEASFRRERARIMQRIHGLIPDEEAEEIARLARYAAGNLGATGPGVPIAKLASLLRLPALDESGAEHWCALAALLLVNDGAFRRTVDRNTGFPPGKGAEAVFKEQMKSLLERLRPIAGLCEALHAVRCMPPASFSDAQWEVLGAMVSILPRSAAHLQVVFSERGQIDFAGLAQGAVAALGEPDAPTDLMLALDVRLRHLLVDEFQDTSLAQWDLLTRLTAGWSEGDGRTVFLVGDPMQSIYRFREADVGLFLEARDAGLPGVALESLRLATNFRSRAGIVEWVNATFARVLPAAEDADAGAVPYAPSSAHHPGDEEPCVQWHAFVGRDAGAGRDLEAGRVALLASEALAADPATSVAILVRNRSHLDRVVPALKSAGIRFRAVDIEPLGARPVVQDLLAVTRALCHPADRVAWLAVLRAPWCALAMGELHALADGEERPTVWEMLADDARLARLAPESRLRAEHVVEALGPFMQGRLRGSLRERVEGAWLALGGPACLERAADLEDAEAFFDQLDGIEEAGDLADPTRLEEHLAELFAAPDVGDGARVQLMTIHKAKGLEFDTVIVPGLDRSPRAADRPLFAWKARADGTLMMAPVRAASEAAEPAYDYLRALEDAACDHELQRLLYVAATRAVRRLHLLGFARFDDRRGVCDPSRRSLLEKAWPVAKGEFERAVPPVEPARQPAAGESRDELRRMELAALHVEVAKPVAALAAPLAEEPARIEFSWAGETARHVGTLTHAWLQRIGMEGLERWDAARVAALAPAITRELARRGVPPAEREPATRRVARALQETLGDERGRWLLQAHPESRFEYRLRVAGPRGVRLVVIDRLFTDASGQRWIVDYKTSLHEGGEPAAFLDREVERYAAQLAGYAAAVGGRVGLGLYFPLMRAWREVAPGLVSREPALPA